MDIICGKCGKHFSSIENAREHGGRCKQSSKDEAIHWLPAGKSELTKEEWDALVKLINTRSNSAPQKSSAKRNKKKVTREAWQDMVRLINTKDKSAPKD